jgi:hypothetical protein
LYFSHVTAAQMCKGESFFGVKSGGETAALALILLISGWGAIFAFREQKKEKRGADCTLIVRARHRIPHLFVFISPFLFAAAAAAVVALSISAICIDKFHHLGRPLGSLTSERA